MLGNNQFIHTYNITCYVAYDDSSTQLTTGVERVQEPAAPHLARLQRSSGMTLTSSLWPMCWRERRSTVIGAVLPNTPVLKTFSTVWLVGLAGCR